MYTVVIWPGTKDLALILTGTLPRELKPKGMEGGLGFSFVEGYWSRRHMTGYAGSRDHVGNLQSPWRTDPHIPLKNRTPTLSLRDVGRVDRRGVLHGDCRSPT